MEHDGKRKKRILVIGGSSYLGSNVLHYLYGKYRLITTYYQNRISIDDVLAIPLDLTNRDSLQKLIFTLSPDAVIYAPGIHDINRAQREPKFADLLNNAAPLAAASSCEKLDILFVYLSRSFVYSGEEGNYAEKEIPRPSTVYGTSLYTAEYILQKSFSNYLIIRTTEVFGRSYNFHRCSYLEFVENHLAAGKSFFADDSIKNGHVSSLLLGKLIYLCIENNIIGRILNFSSPNAMTRFELATAIADVIGADSSIISKKNQTHSNEDVRNALGRSGLNFNLSCKNVEKLFQIAMPTIEEQLCNFYEFHGSRASSSQRGAKKSVYI
jgi:dTDP-4-dehydrorhamnose reductase